MKIQQSEIVDVKWMNLKDYRHEIEDNNPQYRVYSEEFPKLFELIKK